MDKFLILLFVVAKVSSASPQCIASQNASEIFTVDYEGLNFTITFTVPDQCPAIPIIMANVQQGGKTEEYCHFRNHAGSGHCVSSSHSSECFCDPDQARYYVIKASLSEADDEGQEWTITSQPDFSVFNIRVPVALSRGDNSDEDVNKASVPLHTQASQFTTEDTFSPAQNPVTEQSAQSFTTLDPNIIMYAIIGGILLLVLVVMVAFGIILYRKVLSAIRKPAESKPASLHEEPVEQQAVMELQQEVIELQQWPMGNQDGAGNRVSALSNASDAYQTIDDSSSSADSSLGGWPESEFDVDSDSNTSDTAAAKGGATINHDYENEQSTPDHLNKEHDYENEQSTPDHLNKELDYENEQKELARGNGDTVAYENDSIDCSHYTELESDYLNPVASKHDKEASLAQTTPVVSQDKQITADSQVTDSHKERSVAVRVVHHCKPPSDPPVDSEMTASHHNEVDSHKERSVAVRVVHHCKPPSDPPVDSEITASHYTASESDYLNPVASQQETQVSVAQQNDRETTPVVSQEDQGAVGGGWTSGTHSQHIPIPADPTFVAQHKKAPVKFKPCPGKIPLPSGVGGVRADDSSFPRHPSQTRVLPSRSQSSGNLLSSQGGSSTAAARENFNTCPRVPGVHTTSSMGRLDREAMPSSVPEFATDSEGYLEPRQCVATPPRKARAVAGLTQRTALQDGDGAGLQGQGAARQAEGGHKRRDKQ